jgi:predicted kinase
MFVLVGLPAAGKTSRARELASEWSALRLTPDEWMIPLFGQQQPEGKRNILEGRLIWLALSALRIGVNVVLDFGLWGKDERSALRALAASVGATSEMVYLQVDEEEQRRRVEARSMTGSRYLRDDQGRPRAVAARLSAAGGDRASDSGLGPPTGGLRVLGSLGGSVVANVPPSLPKVTPSVIDPSTP